MPRMWLSPSPRSLSQTPFKNQRAVLERLERRQALLELEGRPFLIGPERRRARRRWG